MLDLSRQGYDATGLHIDLGIPGSSEIVRGVIERFCGKHGFKLIVKEMAKEGLAIPLVKQRLKRPICSACGKIKRHYFNKTALEEGFTALATGPNLDDEIARLFSNTLRWDVGYLSDQGPRLDGEAGFARKVKPRGFFRCHRVRVELRKRHAARRDLRRLKAPYPGKYQSKVPNRPAMRSHFPRTPFGDPCFPLRDSRLTENLVCQSRKRRADEKLRSRATGQFFQTLM